MATGDGLEALLRESKRSTSSAPFVTLAARLGVEGDTRVRVLVRVSATAAMSGPRASSEGGFADRNLWGTPSPAPPRQTLVSDSRAPDRRQGFCRCEVRMGQQAFGCELSTKNIDFDALSDREARRLHEFVEGRRQLCTACLILFEYDIDVDAHQCTRCRGNRIRRQSPPWRCRDPLCGPC